MTESKTDEAEPKRIQHATVFVPDGKVKHFVSRFEKYAQTEPKKKRERRHEDMLDPRRHVCAWPRCAGCGRTAPRPIRRTTRPSGGRCGCAGTTATSFRG